MKKMLNTLYITSEDAYAALNGETVEIHFKDGTKKHVPLHSLENIVIFSYKGTSPGLMGKCEQSGIMISYFTPNGKYLASIGSAIKGNILLRKEQFRIADDERKALIYSKNFITGKLYNSKHQLLRTARDHPLQVDCVKLKTVASRLDQYIKQLGVAEANESVMGIEGQSASEYFSVFNELILQKKEFFEFKERSRRPPMDRINAMLSFAYSLLANECANALFSVGLDPYAGFLHADRPGRKSLALDLMEELRSVYADRFVLNLVNNRIIDENDFISQESGGISLNEKSRKEFLSRWQARKREEIMHPFLKEKIAWGLVPYSQALLLARCIRGDLDQYPPFFWR